MNGQKQISEKVIKLLEKIRLNKIYGSVEIYFEGGEITQVTQRIINKITKASKKNFETQKESVLAANDKVQRRTISSNQEFSEISSEI